MDTHVSTNENQQSPRPYSPPIADPRSESALELMRRIEGNMDRETRRLSDEMRNIQDRLSSIKQQTDAMLSRPNDLGDFRYRLEGIASSVGKIESVAESTRKIEGIADCVKHIDHKSPPLAQIYGAATIVFIFLSGALGLSIKSLFTSSEVMEKLTGFEQKIATSVTALETGVGKANTAVEGLTKTKDNLDTTIKSMTDMVTKANKDITQSVQDANKLLKETVDASAKKILEWEPPLATAMQKIQVLADTKSKGGDALGVETPGAHAAESGDFAGKLESLLGSFGGAIPAHMRFLTKARKALDDGNYAQVRTFADEGKRSDVGDTTGVYDGLIGQAWFREGEYLKAVTAFQLALKINAKNDAVLNNLGSVYFAMAMKDETKDEDKKTNLAKSVDYHKQSIAVDENNDVAYSNMATSLNALGVIEQEPKRFQEALDEVAKYKGEETSDIAYSRACSYALLKSVVPALDALGRACTKEPNRALMAGMDSDFKSLRDQDAFANLLKQHLGEELFKFVQSTWKKDSEGD